MGRAIARGPFFVAMIDGAGAYRGLELSPAARFAVV